MYALEVNDINVFRGEVQILSKVRFNVKNGEIVSLIGPNGAGKSTTLLAISGILGVTSGSIRFFGQRIDGMPAHKIARLGLGHVPEGRRLFPFMTVMENLRAGACVTRENKETLEWIFQLFPVLKERKDQLAGTLSGGEQQMLAIGRALMFQPKLLMLDEPSLGLSPKLTIEIFKMIEKINDEGVTILLVEQNAIKALEISERAYVLDGGKIVAEGSGNELLRDEKILKTYLGI
ncbi:MAG: ABC transporter ATP-binding protein [Candidatus Bathyarchaeia archaeon]